MTTPKIEPVPAKLAKTLERPDMVHVKLKTALPGRLEGEVLYVDVNSAGALVGRGDAEWFDPQASGDEQVPIVLARGRANVQTATVAAADMPIVERGGDATAVEEVVQTGTGAGSVVEAPGPDANKADLVSYAEGKLTADDGTPLTTAELERLSKADLRAKLFPDEQQTQQ